MIAHGTLEENMSEDVFEMTKGWLANLWKFFGKKMMYALVNEYCIQITEERVRSLEAGGE